MNSYDDFDEVPDIRIDTPTVKEYPTYSCPEDELYKVYGLRSNLPFKTKIESLYLVYRLSAKDIANLLNATSLQIQDELDNLEEEWKRMGRPLTQDERELQRGRYIAELDRMIQQIDDAISTGQGDSRSMTLKMNAMEKRAKLMGLDLEKHEKTKDTEDEEDLNDTLEKMLEGLPSSALEEMMAVLSDGNHSSSSYSSDVIISDLPKAEGISDTVSSSWELD